MSGSWFYDNLDTLLPPPELGIRGLRAPTPEMEAAMVQPGGWVNQRPASMGGRDGPSVEGPAVVGRGAEAALDFLRPGPLDVAALVAGSPGGPGGSAAALAARRLGAGAIGAMGLDWENPAESANFFNLERLGNLAKHNPLRRSFEALGRAPVEDAVYNPTTQHYLDNMRNVLEAPGSRPRAFQDPAEPSQWLGALNPQTRRLSPTGQQMHAEMDSGINSVEPLRRIWDDPLLMQLYPEIGNVPVTFRPGMIPGAAGVYRGSPRSIEVGMVPDLHSPGTEMDGAWFFDVRSPLRRELEGTLAEEIQHGMQHADGRLLSNYAGPGAIKGLPESAQERVIRLANEDLNMHSFDPVTSQDIYDRARHFAYRGQPNEFEGALVNARQRTGLNNPWTMPRDIHRETFWQLLEPHWFGAAPFKMTP